MEALVPLPPIEKLSPLVTRILAQNPGKFTLQGTNTYLLGSAPPYVLFDTGEGKAEYGPLLEEGLRELLAGHPTEGKGQVVSDVILSHKHKDHHAGLPDVLALLSRLSPGPSPFRPPKVWKFPLPAGETDPTLESTLSQLPPSQRQLQDLTDGQILRAPGVTLRVLRTPGHTSDSVSVHIVEEDSLLTADTVLGQGTAVFEDLAAYIASLDTLLQTFPTAERVYPGHGPVVDQGRAHIKQYISHRLEREQQILDVLSSRSGGCTAADIVSVLYKSYPESLWPAAERGVGLHLRKLEGEDRVTRKLAVAGTREEWEVVRRAGM